MSETKRKSNLKMNVMIITEIKSKKFEPFKIEIEFRTLADVRALNNCLIGGSRLTEGLLNFLGARLKDQLVGCVN